MDEDDTNPRIPPIMRNPAETDEMKRLRDIIEKNSEEEPWEVVGIDADDNGDLIARVRHKPIISDA